jgi:hypothetical protein
MMHPSFAAGNSACVTEIGARSAIPACGTRRRRGFGVVVLPKFDALESLWPEFASNVKVRHVADRHGGQDDPGGQSMRPAQDLGTLLVLRSQRSQ